MNEPRIIPHPHVFTDGRGTFTRSFVEIEGFRVAEENQSFSLKQNTIRGLHWQEPEQTKLVRVLSGAILDVVVNRSTGEVREFIIYSDRGSLLVPKGWAHGFCTLQDKTTVLYKVDEPFAEGAQFSINPFDPALKISWPCTADCAIMSDKDRNAPALRELTPA